MGLNLGEKIFLTNHKEAQYHGDFAEGYDFIYNGSYYEVKSLMACHGVFKISKSQMNFLIENHGYLAFVIYDEKHYDMIIFKATDIVKFIKRHKVSHKALKKGRPPYRSVYYTKLLRYMKNNPTVQYRRFRVWLLCKHLEE